MLPNINSVLPAAIDAGSTPRLSIAQISLFSFRNYEDLALHVTPAPVILTGANGSGKTNLVEGISFLVPGRGLRKAPMAEIQNMRSERHWAVSADLRTPQGALRIGTGRDAEAGEIDKRQVHIDGKNRRSQNLADYVALAWITPDMDRILAEGLSARRRFLDRLVYSFDPSHSARVTRYEKAVRERMRLLREGPFDAQWLNAIESDMAQTAVAIAAARRQLLRQLQTAIAETHGAFPLADLHLHGIAEDALSEQPALIVEDMLRAAYARTRGEDAQSGTTHVGPHKTDLLVVHRAKACPAHLCSTGEQKALLIAIMLAYVRTLSHHRRMTPLFLLDDIAAHLDDTRRKALFDEIMVMDVQAWMTGTDSEPFQSLRGHAQHYVVHQGTIAAGD